MTKELSLAELIKNPELRPKNEELDEQDESLATTNDSIEVKEVGSLSISKIDLYSWLVKNKSVLANQDVKVVEIEITGVPKEENIGIAFPVEEDRKKFIVLNDVDKFFVADLDILRSRLFNKGMVFECKASDNVVLLSYITTTSYTVSVCIMVDDLIVPYYVTKVNRKKRDDLNVPLINTSTMRVKLQELVNFDILTYYYPQILSIEEKGDNWLHYIEYLINLKERITSVPHLIQIDSTIAKTVGLNEG